MNKASRGYDSVTGLHIFAAVVLALNGKPQNESTVTAE